MRLGTNQFYLAIALLLFAAPVYGLSTVDDYENRLHRAERAVNEAVEKYVSARELATMTSQVKGLLPASEDVEFGGAITRVDNSWLYEALNNAAKIAERDEERRLSMLSEIAARLLRLRQSVKTAQTAGNQEFQDQRARLDGILARPEYQPEEKRESFIARGMKKIWEFILRLLAKLFGRSAEREPQGGWAGTAMVLRALIFLVVIAAMIYGAVRLLQRRKARPKTAEKAETREALGEEIPEDATSADMFAMASDLARQGEYRKAIRRAYIALLCEFDQRGKLRLGHAKTNRDYLDAMRSEQVIYPTFSVMTFAFERSWFGQDRATEEDFQNFVTLYKEAIK